MSIEVNFSDLHCHSKNAPLSLQTSKMQNMPSENKPLKDSKKKAPVSCAQNQDGKKVLKEKKSNMCYCSPTTHEGSFRCRLHRLSAPKKSDTEKTNVRCVRFAHGIVAFKPQLSRFGRIASAKWGSHDSLIQLSRLGSS
ncbi:unnamed protein product [Lathyrus oleraceus]|uniref:Uncharacterized protein n=1 Tax=Pisum sativum TaxID=3888 RepID=A0A9D4Y062_PEA|nr:uncharacterized protein LOC127131361 [Pisum sativum]KAI5430259.1 hypothetical protein KIW84_034730 [Pisum sativum]